MSAPKSELIGDDSPWMTVREAATFRRCHPDTIEKNRVAWTEDPPAPGKMRYKLLLVGSVYSPRICRDDVENSGFFIPGKN